MQQDEQQENFTLEYYLRTLRKKVEHHLKNPFEIPFANYSFEELFNWKNNILQLDATSLLYGQRVDHLHSGTLHILQNMVKNGVEGKADENGAVATIKQKMIHDSNPFQRHLQPSAKIDGQQEFSQKNLVLWREIMKKRDTLPLLMLNQLPITNNLRLGLCHTDEKNYYESLLVDEGAFYVKIIDFSIVNINYFQILSTIGSFAQTLNYDLLTLKKTEKPRGRQSTYIQQIINFDFSISHFYGENTQKVDFKTEETFQKQQELLIDIVPLEDNYEQQQTMSKGSNFSLFTIKTTSSMSKKPRKKNEAKKKTKRQEQLHIDFDGFYQSRNEVFEHKKDTQSDSFLTPKDHLLLKYIKYNHPFRKNKKVVGLPQHRNLFAQQSYPLNLQTNEYGQIQSEINQQIGYTTSFNGPKQIQKIKEAALPIKQMKKRIREVIEGHPRFKIADLKQQFTAEDPLDIFIATLHIAAEDAVLLAL